MRSAASLLAVALGLLPNLSIAASVCADSADQVAIERLPVFSSSDGPFILRAQDSFNVFLQKDSKLNAYVPVISKKDDDLPEFLLKDGNLTSADEKVAAYYGPVPKIFPPVLTPLLFSSDVAKKDGAEVVFVTKTRSDGSGREVRRLFFLNGPPVVTSLTDGARIFVKPDGNIQPTIQLDLDVRRPPGSKSAHEDCATNQKYFKNWDLK